ncbi:MAG TPA: STAS domain-containing protein [Casimicrobiaceae bacterium]|nr:STAS domain-containing protein [Casimicrobiaceae bacterium]
MSEVDSREVVTGAFAPTPDGERWIYEGGLTFDNAAEVVEAALELPLPKSGRVDLEKLDPADSSALAALFALKRRAHGQRKSLVFERMPPGLASLAKVYGVEEILDSH